MKPAKYPLPWWIIDHASSLRGIPLAVNRAVHLLAWSYWAGGCKSLPTDDTSLAALALIPQQHMAAIKPQMISALSEILPILLSYHDDKVKLSLAKVRRGQDMAAARIASQRAKSLAAQSANATLSQPARDDPRDKPTSSVVDTKKKSRAAGISSEVASYHD